MLRIAGNCAAIAERSFGVPDGVSSGQFGVGLVVDFLGLAAKNSGFPLEFVYPSVTAIVPAKIALVAGAKSPAAGKRFIQFTLSDGDRKAATATAQKAEVEEEWAQKVKTSYARAVELAAAMK